MFKNIKYLAATSFAAMVVSGCTTAPAPWANPNHNHHARGNVQPPVSVQGGTAHQHGTVVHTHPLPAQGIHHTHQYGSGAGISGRAVGSAGQQAQPAPVRPSQPQPQPQQNQSQTYGYGYGNNSGYNTGSQSPYDGSGNPYNSGNNNNNNYGGGNNTNPSSGGFYGDIGGNNNNSSYGSNTNYGGSSSGGSSSSYDGGSSYDTSTYGGSSSSSSSNLDDIRDPNYRDGDTYYTVQKGNTVFAVMRITGAYWKDVVKWNDLVAPKYTIHPGQRLRVK
ncbi:MAG: LysM peptidoglycan-binding domain-containing protein [bacterium]